VKAAHGRPSGFLGLRALLVESVVTSTTKSTLNPEATAR